MALAEDGRTNGGGRDRGRRTEGGPGVGRRWARGFAHHAGTLAALENDLRWDPRSADVIVGSSAGSVIGTLLRSGISALELAAWCARPSDDPLLAQVRRWRNSFRHSAWVASSGVGQRPVWRSGGKFSVIPRSLRFPAFSSLLPSGRLATSDHRMQMQRLLGEGWPKGALALRDAKRHGHANGLREARLASCPAERSRRCVLRDPDVLRAGRDRRC